MTSPLEFVPLQRGARDANPSGPVHRLQGWLNLWGMACAVDGDFGPETEMALIRFRAGHVNGRVPLQGDLDPETWATLTAPLARAMAPRLDILNRTKPAEAYLGESIAAVARQWLAQKVNDGPLRELAGNSGPVVESCTRWLAERDQLPCFCGHAANWKHCIYAESPGCGCTGYAPDWRLPWCAGWVSTVLRQACESLGVPMPLKGSLSCDELARQAYQSDSPAVAWYQLGSKGLEHIHPGDLFLVRGAKPGDWTHCGVVLQVDAAPLIGPRHVVIRTAEGNTAADGRRNGDRLLERVRPMSGLDFICWRDA